MYLNAVLLLKIHPTMYLYDDCHSKQAGRYKLLVDAANSCVLAGTLKTSVAPLRMHLKWKTSPHFQSDHCNTTEISRCH